MSYKYSEQYMSYELVTMIGTIISAVAAVSAIVIKYFGLKRKMSDKDIFWGWRDAFDRRAFKGSFTEETRTQSNIIKEFHEAIVESRSAITTGNIVYEGNLRKQGLGRSHIRKSDWRKKLEEVEHSLSIIDNILTDHKDSSDIFGEPLKVKKIDDERDKAITILNEIWQELRIPTLPVPTSVPLYEVPHE